MAEPVPQMAPGALRARIWKDYLAPRWPGLAASMACAVVVALLTAGLAAVLRPAITDLLEHPQPGAWIRIPLFVAVLGLLRGAAQVGQATLVNRIGNRVVGDVQVRLFGRLIRSDLARLRTEHSGAYVSSVLYDAGLIQEAATAGVVNFVRESLTVVGAAAVMVWTDPLLSIGLLLAAPVLFLVLRRYSRRTRKSTQGAMAETSALSTAVMESLDGIKIVKIENREAYEQDRVATVIARRQAHLVRGSNARATAAPASETITTIMTAAILAYAGWRAWGGHMDAATFVTFLGAVGIASQSLRQVANLQTVMSQGLTAAGRLFAALDVRAEITDRPGAAALARGGGEIAFEAVDFAYGPEAPVLEALSIKASRGEVVALVGASGAGKSTVLNLIPRFYDVTGGRVLIDGRDVREVTLASLRAQIALVTQEPFLFDDTVAANIAYSRPQATRAEIEAAAQAAAAHEFITALPAGYDTLVGEAGARLSGGQRQRIAIARAFLKDAPILLLDEATSALDTESEAQVQAALARLMAGRTTLLIAHRLSTVRGADRIYVLDRGRVAESGTHEALIRSGGLYARLAGSQDLEHLPEAVAGASG